MRTTFYGWVAINKGSQVGMTQKDGWKIRKMGMPQKTREEKNGVKDEVELRAENFLLDFMASRSFMTWGE